MLSMKSVYSICGSGCTLSTPAVNLSTPTMCISTPAMHLNTPAMRLSTPVVNVTVLERRFCIKIDDI